MEYERTLLYKNEFVETVLIIWPPGVKSCPHDHGISDGLVIVEKGRVFQQVFSKATKEFLGYFEHEAQTQFAETTDIIHIMGNASGSEEAKTIHVYSPPLSMHNYEDSELIYTKDCP